MNNFKLLIKGFTLLIFFGLLMSCGGGSSDGSGSSVLNLTGVVTTLAGNGAAGFLDGTGTAAQFNHPRGINNDGTNLYVGDTINHSIRQVAIATGVVTTLAGDGTQGFLDGIGTAAQFYQPGGIASDGTNLYVADKNNHSIRQVVIATGVVTTLAGDGTSGFLDDTGTAARFSFPFGITTDGINLYVADSSNHRIRQVVIATGVVTTLAGSTLGSIDGTGTAAKFYRPRGIITDGANLYVGDTNNTRIRQVVIATGVVTTLAGSIPGFLDGIGTAALFEDVDGITTDGTNLYVADSANYSIRQVVIATGVVTTLAGDGTFGFLDGTGTAARFNAPGGITTDGTNLYVADRANYSIRQIE